MRRKICIWISTLKLRVVYISLRSLYRMQYMRLLLFYSVIFQSVIFQSCKFQSCKFSYPDLNPKTMTYKLKLYTLTKHLNTKNEVSRSRRLTVRGSRAGRTHTRTQTGSQTDRRNRTHYQLHSQMVIIMRRISSNNKRLRPVSYRR